MTGAMWIAGRSPEVPSPLGTEVNAKTIANQARAIRTSMCKRLFCLGGGGGSCNTVRLLAFGMAITRLVSRRPDGVSSDQNPINSYGMITSGNLNAIILNSYQHAVQDRQNCGNQRVDYPTQANRQVAEPDKDTGGSASRIPCARSSMMQGGRSANFGVRADFC